jgi:polar amino acid transport system substrate-binding protein
VFIVSLRRYPTGPELPAHPEQSLQPFTWSQDLMQVGSRLAAAIVATALFAAASVHADQLADVRKRGELVCGVLGTDEPNSFIDPRTREIIGYEVDLCRAVAKKIGVKLKVKQLAVAARIPELQQGRVDILAASLSHTRERESVVDFSLTTFVTGQRALVRKDSGITQLSQLAGKKVVTVKGGTQEPNIRKAVPNVEVVTFETAPQAFVALQQRKGAGFVNDEISLLNAYSKLGPAEKDYVILQQNISTEILALGLKKGETALKAATDDALRDLEKSGEAEKIFFRWFGPNTKMKFQTRNFKFESDRIAGES